MKPNNEAHPCTGCKHAQSDRIELDLKDYLRHTCALTWFIASGTCARFEHAIKPTPLADKLVKRWWDRVECWSR